MSIHIVKYIKVHTQIKTCCITKDNDEMTKNMKENNM
jgi:hypothetical protein